MPKVLMCAEEMRCAHYAVVGDCGIGTGIVSLQGRLQGPHLQFGRQELPRRIPRYSPGCECRHALQAEGIAEGFPLASRLSERLLEASGKFEMETALETARLAEERFAGRLWSDRLELERCELEARLAGPKSTRRNFLYRRRRGTNPQPWKRCVAYRGCIQTSRSRRPYGSRSGCRRTGSASRPAWWGV